MLHRTTPAMLILGALPAIACCDATWSEAGDGAPGAAAYDPAPASCGGCHPQQHAEWAASAHARSARQPTFRALLPEVEASWGPTARAACERCHAGAALEPEPAIGCVTCHAATGNRGTRDGRLTVLAGAPLAGPTGAAAGAPHATRDGDFLRAPDLCGTCHEVTGPRLFVEPTLTEFRASPAAAAGLTCQGCHMPRTPDGHTDHRFPGFRDDALLATALRLDVAPLPGGGARVTLTNAGAGHAVPTGATLVRELWVEVDAGDGPRRVIALGADLRDAAGERVTLPTDAATATIATLAPGESVAADVAGNGAVTARLVARAVEGELAAALGVEDDAPARVIATARLPAR